jgi:hypothetical protein
MMFLVRFVYNNIYSLNIKFPQLSCYKEESVDRLCVQTAWKSSLFCIILISYGDLPTSQFNSLSK